VANLLGDLMDVTLDRVNEWLAGLLTHGHNSRPDLSHDSSNVSRRGLTGDRRLHRAAAGMTNHDDKSRAQMLDRILNAAKLVIADHFAGGADDKEITNILVEDQLGRRALIRASDDDSKGMLRLRRLQPAGASRLGRAIGLGDEIFIPGFELCERRFGSHRRCGMLGGKEKSAANGKHESDGNHNFAEGSFHNWLSIGRNGFESEQNLCR